MSEPIDDIADHLREFRIRFGTEAVMQSDVALALCNRAAAEHRLSDRDRIDFYLPTLRIGVECKVAGGPTDVLSQLLRYAASPEIDGLILVTRRRSHCFTERALGGKPLRIVYVGGSQL